MTRGRIVGPRYIVPTLKFCLFLVLGCSCYAAVDNNRALAQFAHTAWGPKDGAPSVVTGLAQSADGYLWLGSTDGLYRFDGVVFERYQPKSGGPFPAQNVTLLALPNGDLWIGFRAAGISLLRNGHATNYTTRQGVPAGRVWSLAQDREGTIWAATASGLARLEGDRWKQVGKDWNFSGKSAHAIFLDRQGTLWVSTENTLIFLPPGARRFQPTDIPVGAVTNIAEAANGKLWMAETTRSVRPIPLRDKWRPPDATEVQVGSEAILFDKDGALWITSIGDGLRRSPAPESLQGRVKEFSTAVESFTAKDGLSDDVVRSILEDREGNIWVGTNTGLDRFRKTNLVPVILPIKPMQAVLAPGDSGDVWVYEGFMVRIHGGRADRDGHPFPSLGISAYRDSTGAIWWLCSDAIYRYVTGKYATVALPTWFPKPYLAGLIKATEDGSGAIWLSVEREGLFYRKGSKWQRLETASEFGKMAPWATFTDWMGRAWFGYEDGTIILLKDENVQKVFLPADSPVGSVRAINGRSRNTWVGGQGGLSFFDGNRFQRIIPADAEAFGLVWGVEETADGSLWLAESRGVIQIPASEVRQALDNPSYHVEYRMFGFLDGLPGTFAGTSSTENEIQGTDGRLWFAASGGIVWIDPANISTNSLAPHVLIRTLKANGRQPGSLANLVLPPRTTGLEIGYTALSLSVPEKIRFRYRLEGVDKDWQEAGTRRTAFYNRLGPGGYHFQVIACNNDGVWNDVGATLDFGIAPAWYQTTWFRAACVGALLLLLWAAYQLRVRQLEQRFATVLDARVNERTRIARDLHDTLLQSLHGLLLSFQRAANLLPDRPVEAKERLEGAIDQAARAITESRDAVQGLRSSAVGANDLAVAIQTLGEELAAKEDKHNSPVFDVAIQGKQRDLNPILRDDVYRIVGEAVRNAFQHAQARRIEVEMHYDDRQLRVRIRDDGKGVEAEVLSNEGRPGHWGLPGMRERAKLVGGKLEVWSQLDSGAEIELTIPGSTAYLTSVRRLSKERTA